MWSFNSRWQLDCIHIIGFYLLRDRKGGCRRCRRITDDNVMDVKSLDYFNMRALLHNNKRKAQITPSLISLEKAKEVSFCDNIKEALKLPNYVKLIFAFSLLQGGFLAFGTNIDQLFAPVGFSDVDISMLGAGVILVGVCSSMVSGILLNKYHKYLLMIRLSAVGSFIIVGLAVLSFQTKNTTLISINMIVAAICLVPVIPVSIDFAGELTFP